MAPEELRIEAIDEVDLDRKIWALREQKPGKRVVMGPVERLPIKVRSPFPTRKITAENTVAVIVEVHDAT
ncbi:MAG TPA: hypothetical protein VIV09_12775 [Pseudolabrys sp.]|jgi:hypothetical protein